ncbi:MAG: OmpA family protein [Paludibacteraceae bacterium]|nr:OmpA family protein [Paludibacteraceae bacterium]
MNKKIFLSIIAVSLASMTFAQEQKQEPQANETVSVAALDSMAQAQAQADSARNAALAPDPVDSKHYLRLYGKVGYAAMFDDLSKLTKNSDQPAMLSNQQLLGGPGAGIGFGYDYEYRYFRASVGIEFNYLRSTSKYAFDMHRPVTLTQTGVKDLIVPLDYTYRFGYLNETRNIMHVGVPVMVGAQLSRYFLMVGVRAGYNLVGNATTSGEIDVTAWDPQLISQIGNNKGLGLTNYTLDKNKHKLDLKQPELSILAEFGLDLDEWLQVQPKKKKKGRKSKQSFKESLHYKVSVFAEYSLLNQNGSTADMQNLAKFDQFAVSDMNSMLTMPKAVGSTDAPALKNLFVGLKFAVQFQIPEKKPVAPPVKKPRPVKQREEHARQEVTAQLNGIVYNLETQLPIKADVVLLDSTGQEVYNSQSDSTKGTFATKLPAGKYHILINKQGYLPYDEDIEFSLEALKFELQPLKKGTTYIIRNLYFDTNATTIQERSEESLKELFSFLNDNKDVRIKLIGHTDSVGKDEDNQILSEGRAQSVMQEMIERGIDPERLEAEGRGETEPIDTNDTEEGRQNNRRVVVEIL